jgi:hypothetical protein
MKKWILTLLLACAAGTAMSGEPDTLERIREQQRMLAADLDRGVLGVSATTATEIRQQQSTVFALLDTHPTLDQMSVEDRIALDSALQRINATLVGTAAADRDQRECRHEMTVGSKMKKATCRTKGEWAQIEEEARAYRSRNLICVPPGCGEDPTDTVSRAGGHARGR